MRLMKINAQKKESFYNFPFLYNENPALDAGFSLYKQKGTPSSAFLKMVRFCFAIIGEENYEYYRKLEERIISALRF